MILYNTPLIMVLVFLVLTLVLGLYVSTLYVRKKENKFIQYALGNKQFHTNTLVVTVLATAFGGGVMMRGIPNVYNIGTHYIISLFAWSISFGLISLLGLRMGPFMTHLSVAETIGSVYGKYPRTITALLGICWSIGIVSIQINVMSSTIVMCIDSIDPRIVTVPATLILIAYAILGGVRAITITDILQFATFTIIIPLLIKFLFVKTDKSFLGVILFLRKKEDFQFSNMIQFDKKFLKIILNSLGAFLFLNPSVVHRIYMSSSPIQVHKVFKRVTLFSVIIWGCIISVGLLVFVGNPMLPVTEIWSYILIDMPAVYKGFVVISLLGMTMSTADSCLHTAAIMVSHDMVETIRWLKAAPYIHQLRLAKLTVLVVGLLAMILTLCCPDLFELSKFVFGYLTSVFTVTVTSPFILAVFGFRSSARTALIGMATGILVGLVWETWVEPEIGINNRVISIMANGLAMIAAHYLLPQPPGKGWIGVGQQYKRMKQLIRIFKKHKKSIDLE
ncbi:Sodium:solute symporter family protein [Cardinium endosymbiont of Sogatella furcifera]|uniref:sodium:solute symporter family protein n=1 Tax=Cardinium endosymbiont of Sogatella furcifera TaxID=650378 RepID=UPI000E0D6047|nr:hypothetical protein [Cardinium endosymbiont of Sogatella furcifera]AXI23990.1 Sodium:solute symporter family protein [Cardinium endosymbiont of Sogatella furcifera]